MRTIAAHFFTTINTSMCLKAAGLIFNPFKWSRIRRGESVDKLKLSLLSFLNLNQSTTIIDFYNARSALYHGIKTLGIGAGDEIILQSFTCVSVSNSVIQSGATPVYCDIDKSLNIDPYLITDLITKNTKAVLIQHTFGNPADLEKIKHICKSKGLLLIEDCAHSLGSEYGGEKVGRTGDVSVFSLGRDKVISSVNGGFLIINNKSYSFDQSQLIDLPLLILLKNLLYLIISYIAFKSYDFFGLGKVIIFISRKLSIIPEVLSSAEKKCQEKDLNYSLPNGLAIIGLSEFHNIEIYNKHRTDIAEYYNKFFDQEHRIATCKDNHNIYLRYPYLSSNSEAIMRELRNEGIIAGDWYRHIIDPCGVKLEDTGYKKGSCPVSEEMSSMVINLPNHISIKQSDARDIVRIIHGFYK